MVHKHSVESEQKRFIKRLVIQGAFQDVQRSETVNILSADVIARHVAEAFEFVLPGLISNYERGEVLLDPRGEGSFQERVPPE